MVLLLLTFSMLLVLVALGVLVRSIIPLVAELKQTARIGAESCAGITGVIADMRKEEGRLRDDLELLSGAVASWPRAAGASHEMLLLVRNIRSVGAAIALLSTLRRVPW